MNPKHIRVWPIGDLPADAIDLVNESGKAVVSIGAMDPEDRGEPSVMIDDKHVRILVDDTEVTRAVIERELKALSKATNITWLYIDSDQKFLELLEKLKAKKGSVQ